MAPRLKHVDEQLSIRIIRTAIDRGINFLDNCWDYNDGESELRMGKALARRLPRKRVPDDEDRRPLEEGSGAPARRVAAPPADRPHRSGAAPRDPPLRGPAPHLRRGGRPRGAARGAEGRARCATSASPATRTRGSTCTCSRSRGSTGSMFDTVQMPLNVMDAHYRSFEQLVLPELVQAGHRRARHEAAGQRHHPQVAAR